MAAPVDVVVMLHSHLPYVLNHGRWPHGSDWICEAAVDTYLPLIDKLRGLEEGNVATPLTVGITPILANQLAHPTFQQELDRYFDQRLHACDEAPASLRETQDEHLLPVVDFWRRRFLRLRALLHAIDHDILGELRRMQDAERLEIITSAATHAFLPLLGRDESIRLQLSLGMVEHRRWFGVRSEGCWLPECAYRPRGAWTPLPGAPPHGVRRGIEEHLADAGYRYCFVDAHIARAGSPLGVYGQLFGGEAERVAGAESSRRRQQNTPYRAYRITGGRTGPPVAALVRDPRSSTQVWSRHGGYPGDASYLEFHKRRWPGGLRLWRVSAPDTDLGDKAPYEPSTARARAHDHAEHFAAMLAQIAEAQAKPNGNVIVAPFDTELFGHWWFEGPDFLGDLYVAIPGQERLRAVTAGQHVAGRDPRTTLRLGRGSWGRNGDYTMWLNNQVAWMWPMLWSLEDAFWDLAPRALAREDLRDIVAQAAREMLLAQSSDWQFIISTGEVEDYAIRRFNEHVRDADALVEAMRDGAEGLNVERAHTLTQTLRRRDDVFADILPSIQSSLEHLDRLDGSIRSLSATTI
jgi:1,4-alpha-glucan branching enzyme